MSKTPHENHMIHATALMSPEALCLVKETTHWRLLCTILVGGLSEKGKLQEEESDQCFSGAGSGIAD